MLNIGLTSVTFRELSCPEIIDYCKKCGISHIEWGSDVHIPAGNTEYALSVKKMCDDVGLKVSSYGSYYRCGTYENAEKTFKSYLDTAKALGAKTIRIWVGEKNYEEAQQAYVQRIVNELKLICAMAEKEKIEIGCEFHGGTLCNTCDGALSIVNMVGCSNFGMYFQYDYLSGTQENCHTLKSFIPILKNVHVFYIDGEQRMSLSEKEGTRIWQEFIEILKDTNTCTNLLFEFLKNPTCEDLLKETIILKEIINRYN